MNPAQKNINNLRFAARAFFLFQSAKFEYWARAGKRADRAERRGESLIKTRIQPPQARLSVGKAVIKADEQVRASDARVNRADRAPFFRTQNLKKASRSSRRLPSPMRARERPTRHLTPDTSPIHPSTQGSFNRVRVIRATDENAAPNGERGETGPQPRFVASSFTVSSEARSRRLFR